MSKAKIVRDSEGKFYGIRFNCPGCLWPDGTPIGKTIPVGWLPPGETEASPHVANKPKWGFNGDFERPVLTPSVLQDWESSKGRRCCHSFVGCNGAQPGQITFLGDSTHHLSGHTVDLPDVDEA